MAECREPPLTIQRDERVLQQLYNFIVQFEDDLVAVNDRLVNVCGTVNTNFLVTVSSSLLGYTCVAVGILWRLREAFQCSTWLPLYYNTVYNAMCYNGVNGVWAIAATQFLTCFMACVILTCRAVFLDLEIEGEDEKEENDDQEEEEEEEEYDLKLKEVTDADEDAAPEMANVHVDEKTPEMAHVHVDEKEEVRETPQAAAAAAAVEPEDEARQQS